MGVGVVCAQSDLKLIRVHVWNRIVHLISNSVQTPFQPSHPALHTPTPTHSHTHPHHITYTRQVGEHWIIMTSSRSDDHLSTTDNKKTSLRNKNHRLRQSNEMRVSSHSCKDEYTPIRLQRENNGSILRPMSVHLIFIKIDFIWGCNLNVASIVGSLIGSDWVKLDRCDPPDEWKSKPMNFEGGMRAARSESFRALTPFLNRTHTLPIFSSWLTLWRFESAFNHRLPYSPVEFTIVL